MSFVLILFLFIFSGALGLGYQVIWSKYLLDFIGVSAYSYATVLAAFMAGLALGSKWIGKWADRSQSPLKLYAYLEFGIAMYALLYAPLSDFVGGLYGRWISFTPDHAGSAAGLWAKVISSGLLLLPPTILMGGTYPVLLRFVTRKASLIGRRASQLYSANAFGAVLGTISMSFLFLPSLGMSASLMLLAIANAAIALVAFLLSSGSPSRKSSDPVSSVFIPLTKRQVRLALFLISVEGAIAFTYEIAWTRFFGIILGSSTYSFSIMLAAFISGIAAGGAWLARLEKRIRNPFAFLGWTQFVAALLILLPLPLYPYLGWIFEQFSGLLSFRASAFYLYEFGKLLLCYLIMLPPTIFIGMAVPLAVKGLSSSLSHLGQDTGRVYSWNTLGNVAGALLAGLVFLPLLGMEWLLRVNILGTLAVGLAAWKIFSGPGRSRFRWLVFAIPALFTVWHQSWDLRWLTLVPFRRYDTPRPLESIRAKLNTEEILFAADDPACHVMVKRTPTKPQETISLLLNGKTDASNSQDMMTQVVCAHLPLLLHPAPKDVMIIGLASGVTAGSVLKHPVERTDVVEIVRAMPAATNFFLPWNGNPSGDARYHLILDDARSYLTYTSQTYDIIISEPSNPWMAGIGSLYSRDFYERGVHALRKGGIYLQWLQAYEMGDESFAAIVRSFRSVFPYIYAFQGTELDILLLGSLQPLVPDWRQVQSRLEQPAVGNDLKRVHVDNLSSLLYLQRYSPATSNYVSSLTLLENTDDNHLLEYRAPRDLFQRATATVVRELDERLTVSPSLFWSQWLRSQRQNPQILSVLALLNRSNIGDSEVVKSFQDAYDFISSREDDLLESRTLAGRVFRMLKTGQTAAATELIDSASPSIYIAATLSPEQAQFWKYACQKWMEATSSPEMQTELRVFRIELLAATGEIQPAGDELLAWVRSDAPPSYSWAVLRAFQIDSMHVGPSVLKTYSLKVRDPVLERMQDLLH